MPHYHLSDFPGWSFNGKTYKTVAGLLNALAKDSGAPEISMVDSNNQIKARAADRKTVVATYNVAQPKVGKTTAVTRVQAEASVSSFFGLSPYPGR